MTNISIETIQLRPSTTVIEQTLVGLNEQVNTLKTLSCVKDAYLLEHSLYKGEFVVVIIWQDRVLQQKTNEGLQLAENLKPLGNIYHTVWAPTRDLS